jgi:hypothetical protein
VGPAFATAGTDFLESCVGQTATVPEFQGHPGSDTAEAAILFLKTRKIQDRPNLANKEEWGTLPLPCFSWSKTAAMTKQCAPAHCPGESTSLGSATILYGFGSFAPSDVANPTGCNAGSPFGLQE